jgi:hypothetical protein
VRDPENWEVITKVQIDKPPHEDDTFKKAAHDLHETLKGYDWYSMVGMGAFELIVYTAKKKHPISFEAFAGFPVKYKYMGKIAPLNVV